VTVLSLIAPPSDWIWYRQRGFVCRTTWPAFKFLGLKERVSSTRNFFSPSDSSAGSQMPLPSQVANMPVCDASPSGVSRPRLTRFESTHGNAFNLSPPSPSRGGQPNLLSPSVWLSYNGKTGPRSTRAARGVPTRRLPALSVVSANSMIAVPSTRAIAVFTTSSAPHQ